MSELELYDINDLPLSTNENKRTAQEKILRGEKITLGESILFRDKVVRNIDGYELKPNCVYSAISKSDLERYELNGSITGNPKVPNKRHVNWFLGGTCFKYGNVIIECPAIKEYFYPSNDNGNELSSDPLVKHFHSSVDNPVPMHLVKVIYYQDKLTDEVTNEQSKLI